MKAFVLWFVILLSEQVWTKDVVEKADELFPVSFIHINDLHARFEETNEAATSCKPEEGQKCIGGYARAVTVIKQLLANRTNPLYLNAGDNFQGTLWYNIGRWNVTSYFLNMLKADAVTLGNHEFDHDIAGVVPFMETLESPIVLANVDDSEEPTFQNKYNHSIIIDKYGRKIGIIGIILSTTKQIASIGKLNFLDESETVRKEAALLKQQGVDIIVVLSHSGLDVDYEIAKNGGPDVDIIIGGHSHTFMYTGDKPPGPDKPRDEYPAIVINEAGHKVLIVQASAYCKYIGDLTVYFDAAGNVQTWEGAPIYLDADIEPDKMIMEKIQPWKEFIDKTGLEQIGVSKVQFTKSSCDYGECNLGNFLADGYVDCYVERADNSEWTYSSIALLAVGGIRASINKGSITYGDLVASSPFENTLDTMDLRGDHLVEMLEYSMELGSWDQGNFSARNMVQISGLKVVYNVTMPAGNRVTSVTVLCNKCDVPSYYPLNKLKMYKVIIPSFLARGGDGFDVLPDHGVNHKVGMIDIDCLVAYTKRMNPLMVGLNNRITITT